MFWLNGCFNNSAIKKAVEGAVSTVKEFCDTANKTYTTDSSSGSQCFEKVTSDEDNYDTFVNYNDGSTKCATSEKLYEVSCGVSGIIGNCIGGITNAFNKYFGFTTLSMLEGGGTSCDKPGSSTGGSSTPSVDDNSGTSDDSTNVSKVYCESGDDSNDGIMTLAMLEEGDSSVDGQISTKAMYEEGGSDSDSDKPSWGKPDCDKPSWGKPDCDKPSWGKPDCDKPSWGKPDCDKPDYDKPDCDNKPDYDKPDCGDKPNRPGGHHGGHHHWGHHWGHHHWGHHHWGHHWGGSRPDCGGDDNTDIPSVDEDVDVPNTDDNVEVPPVDDNVDVPPVDDNVDVPPVVDDGECEDMPEVEEPEDDFTGVTLPDNNNFGSVDGTTTIMGEDGA